MESIAFKLDIEWAHQPGRHYVIVDENVRQPTAIDS
jgi:hypothetical protein